MKPEKFAFIIALVACFIPLPGCQPKPSLDTKSKPVVFRLFDLFRPEDLAQKVTPEEAGWRRYEWHASDMAPWSPQTKKETNHPPATAVAAPSLSFRALNDLRAVAVDQGKLVGEITAAAPVLDFTLKENRGGAESVKFIEVRMSVSGAKQVWLRRGESPSIDEKAVLGWASQKEAWKTSVDAEDGKVQTYRFEVQSEPPLGGPNATSPTPGPNGPVKSPPPAGGPGNTAAPPAELKTPAPPTATTPAAVTPNAPMAVPTAAAPAPTPPPPATGGSPATNPSRADLRHFLIAFRECKSGKFSIDSIRFMTEKEEKLKEPSGQQWAGLAEIYRATLAAKTPESIRIPLRELPERARLDFAIGTKEDAPVKFKVAVVSRDGSKESDATPLFERTVTTPDRWQTVRVDLAGYAGKSVMLEFTLAGEKKGLWGYWGSPVIRSHSDAAAAMSGSGGTQAKRKPRGVIFLVTDTLRKDHLNIYGYPRETLVHLKKFSEEGVAFRHAISQATMTKISVPSMVTSLYPMSHTVLGFDHGLPASAKTIAEVFRDEGYATVAYSSVPFTGKMNNMHQGYDELHESASSPDKEYNNKSARYYVDRLIPWLEEHRDEPFFVFLHVFDAHSPFRPRPPYDTLWGAPGAKERLAELEADMRKLKIPMSFNLPPKAEYIKTGNDPDELLKIYIDWYDGAIRGMDAEIGRLLEALREMGLDKDTLMVWAADHGEEFWEHGRLFHGHSVYGELNQVPMVYRWPNSPDVRKGIMIDQQVQNLDIMPTILDLAGIQGPSTMQGRSLVPLLNGSGAANWEERPAITQAMVRKNLDSRSPATGNAAETNPEKPHFGIIDHGWKLVRKEFDPEAQQELYEHPIDSLNLTNVINSEGVASHSKALLTSLETWRTKARAAQLPGDDTIVQQVSSEELRRLRALGYVGGGTPAKPTTNTVAKTNTVANTNSVGAKAETGKNAGGQ